LSNLKNAAQPLFNYSITNFPITQLFHFFMRRMLAATAAEFLELQPFGRRLPVLGGRIIPLFAITALHRHNFSGHFKLPLSALGCQLSIQRLSFRTRAERG
jgi:hypothetical protein